MIRRLASRWWQILSLWFLLSVPLAYLIYSLIEPTYQAVSLLRAEPTTPDIFGGPLHQTPDMGEVKPYLLTQVQLIKSNMVLDAALAKPEISRLKMVRAWRDPKAELRKDLQVTIVGDNTYLIQVALSSRDAAEAADIVNAVVDAYLEEHGSYKQAASKTLKQNLEAERTKLDSQMAATREKLEYLARQRGSTGAIPRLNPVGKVRDGMIDPSLDTVTEPQFVEMTSWLLKADFELMDTQARLEAARLPASQTSPEKIRDLESQMEAARKKRDSYKHYLSAVKVERRSQNADSIEQSLLTQDLNHLKHLHEVIESKLSQIEFEMGQEPYRITRLDRAVVPRAPADNRRVKFMALASVGVLFVILGTFFLGEIRDRRYRGPDAD